MFKIQTQRLGAGGGGQREIQQFWKSCWCRNLLPLCFETWLWCCARLFTFICLIWFFGLSWIQRSGRERVVIFLTFNASPFTWTSKFTGLEAVVEWQKEARFYKKISEKSTRGKCTEFSHHKMNTHFYSDINLPIGFERSYIPTHSQANRIKPPLAQLLWLYL